MLQRSTMTPEFSIAQARGVVKDLFDPNPTIYWVDFLASVGIGMASFAASRRLELPGWAVVVLFCISVLAFYRAVLFTHELCHFRKTQFRNFRIAWNLLCGIPFMVPSFLYHIHLEHHARRYYGTAHDGEYLPFGTSPTRMIVSYLAQSFIIPLLGLMRFMVLPPLAWVFPGVRRWVQQRASSMIIDPSFIRPIPTQQEYRLWYLQETCCFLFGWTVAVLLLTGIVPWMFLLHVYLLAVCIISLNAIRTLAAHRYTLNGEENATFVEQLQDSLNFPDHPLTGELWAPVGLRFHALHHLFPSMPYHNLGKAHRRLMAELPADSIYRQTECASLPAALKDLWQRAKAAQTAAETTPAQAAQ